MKRISMVSLAVGMVLLGGCEKKAEGQVAAVVNGEEITLQEVNAELGNKVPQGVATSAARQAALQQIVQRRLLAQAARDDGLDKSPDYLIKRRTLDDALLIQLLSNKVSATIKVPDERALDKFIKDRPAMFADRTVLSVDRVQFSPGDKTGVVKQLEPTHSMEEVIAVLKANKIEFSRGQVALDTVQLNPQFAKQIMSLPDGEPFILPQGGLVTVGAVMGKRSAPIAADQAKPLAVTTFRNEQLSEAVQRRLNSLMAQAKIEYQPGFAPPKPEVASKGDGKAK